MTWPMLITLLLQFFGPLVADWLSRIAVRAGPQPGPFPPLVRDAIPQYFAALRARTRWWNPLHWPDRARLAACERVALDNVASFSAAMRFGAPMPKITPAEYAQVAAGL